MTLLLPLAPKRMSSGSVFRAVAIGGRVSDQPLADDSAARIVKRCAERAGLDPAQLPATACARAFSRQRRGGRLDLEAIGAVPAPLA